MTKENQPGNPIDQLLPAIAAAVSKWQIENSPEKIATRVHRMLDKESTEITMKLLGFDNRYGEKWHLDHCNGRSGESAAGDFIRKAHAEAIKEWLTEVCLPKLTPELKAKLQKDAQKEFEDRLRRQVYQAAVAAADQVLEDFIQEFVKSKQIEGHLTLQKLLNPEGIVHAS